MSVLKKKKTDIRFLNRYYNKLMLINTAIVLLVSVLYGVIASSSAFTYERLNLLKAYEDTLNQLHTNYSSKQDEFHNLMLTFYEDNKNFDAISTLLDNESSDIGSLGAFDLQAIIKALKTLCNKDRSIYSTFIYKAKTQTLYAYSPNTDILQIVNKTSPLYNELSSKDFPRITYGVRNVSFMEPAGNQDNPVYIYGIGGNLSSINQSMIKKPGNVMVAYNTTGLERSLQNKDLRFSGRFMIISLNGQVIFDSEKKYNQEFNTTSFSGIDSLIKNYKTVMIDGATHYVSTITDDKRGYLTAYFVPKSEVDKSTNYFSILISIGAVIFCGISLFVFILASRLSSRRVGLLEVAMTQIGSNNLTYRIPVGRQTDEFSAISKRFNEMCDELQDKIEKAYVYEIKQKSAELYALQTSINPHFLYNTLEAIRVHLSQDGNSDAAEMVVILSRLYRNQIKGKLFITLREEISQCHMYLELFSLRHDHRFQCSFNVHNEILKYGIPKNTLQPILENYLVHGMKEEDNRIIIRASLESGIIEITVEDNGRGILPEYLASIQKRLTEKQETSDSGFGLSNVNERLKIVYGKDYGLSINHRGDEPGTVVTLSMKALSISELEQLHHSNLSQTPMPE